MATRQPIKISELFYSLQGESTFAGLPCVFIRLAGCNLRCNYCDARYTYEEEAISKSVAELVRYACRYPNAVVEITGGEPLLQDEVYPLIQELLNSNRTVLLETNGSISLCKVPAQVIKIVDIKCPDSGMHEHMDKSNLAHLNPDDELKFVLSSRDDYLWAKKFLQTHNLPGRQSVLFSPVPDLLPPRDLADWILTDQLAVRLQLQLHKILWPDIDRAV